MSEFNRTTLGALALDGVLVLGDGYRTRQDQFSASGYRVLRVADIENGAVHATGPDFVHEDFARAIGAKSGRAGDVLLTTKGTVGRVAILPDTKDRIVYSPQLCFFRIVRRDLLEPRFLAYWFKSAEFISQSSHMQSNTDMAPYISLTDLKSVKIGLPSLKRQSAIAEVMGALDDKIAANVRLGETLEQFIRAKFVRATRQLIARPFFDVVDVEYGEAFKGSLFSQQGEGRPLIRIRDIKSLVPQVWTTEARPREIMVQPGDLIIGMDAEFRPTPWLGVPGLLNQRVCRASSRQFGSAYLWQALKRPLTAIENEKSATTVIHLNKSDLMRSTIDVPASDDLIEFERQGEPAFVRRVALSSENRTLATLRDALLPQLMSGKLRVRDAERTLSEVL